jgi:hypothetical protein
LFGVVSLLIPFLRFPSLLWRVDQRRVNPVFFTHLLVVVLNPCMLVPCRPWCLLGSCSDNHTAKNPGDVLVHLVHIGHGTLQVVWALVFCCVCHFLRCPVSCHGVCIGRGSHLSSLLPCSILSWFLSSYNGIRIKRERDFSCL